MKDKDYSSLEEVYKLIIEKNDNIFAGIVDEEDDDKEEKDESEDKEEKEEKDDKKSDDEDDEESDDEESDDEESDDEDDDKEESDEDDEESDDEESDDEESDDDLGDKKNKELKGDSQIQGQIKKLQKQYNDILVDAFGKYAPECITTALEESEVAIGEDITNIVASAVELLKTKVLQDFGIDTAPCCNNQEVPLKPVGGGNLGGMVIDLNKPEDKDTEGTTEVPATDDM